MIKKLVIWYLQQRAQAVLERYEPIIVAVTGSYGKTSTKNAIEAVLSGSKKVRAAKGNFNNEIGVPLSILGVDSPGSSVFGWVQVFLMSFAIKEYPEVLILEFGADRPGDIVELTKLAPPQIGILTGISPVHVSNYLNFEALMEEKGALLSCLPKNGLAVVNADDENAVAQTFRTRAEVKLYGERAQNYQVKNIKIEGVEKRSFQEDEVFVETVAALCIEGVDMGELRLPNVIGYAPVMSCLAALVVSNYFGIALVDAITRLEQGFLPAAGRLRPLAGIKGSLIIDDSYNASPAAMMNGLKVLKEFPLGNESGRRIAVLGSMAELGAESEIEHGRVGKSASGVADLLILVGEEMRIAKRTAVDAGMNADAIEWFQNSYEAGRYLDRQVREGDIVYVKGSQSARMEKVVKDLMAQPTRAGELLVRQGEKWLKS